MTQVGEGVAAGGGQTPNIDDLDDNHWLELEYRFQSGRAVYGYFRATDSDGLVWVGRLNDQGQVCLAGLPPGNVRVELLPAPDLDARIEATRASIKEVLDQIIEDQRLEAEAYERELEQMGGPQRVFEHVLAVGRGAWNGAVGLVEFVGKTAYKVAEFSYYMSPANLLGDTLRASYQSYQDGELTWSEWYDSVNQNLQDEQKKDLARLFGVEPDDISEERLRELMGLIAEAYDIAAFIADDAPTREMLLEFAQAMADNQSSVEWAEFAGAGVFEIVLAALLALFTAGAGNVAQAVSQLRHASRLRGLGHLFRNLARQLRRKKLRKEFDAPVDQKTSLSTDQPDPIDIRARSRQASEAHGVKPTPEDVRLAKSVGSSSRHLRAREKVARSYLEENGFSDEQIAQALGAPNGITGGVDLTKPVDVVQFPPPDTMVQYTRSHGYPGNWFDPLGSQSPDALGLNGKTRERSIFKMPVGSGLRSYAKPVTDDWTVPDSPLDTSGGGVQVFVNDEIKSSVSRLK